MKKRKTGRRRYLPYGIEGKIICKHFLEDCLKFYEDPENLRGFEEWKAQRRNKRDYPRASEPKGTV